MGRRESLLLALLALLGWTLLIANQSKLPARHDAGTMTVGASSAVVVPAKDPEALRSQRPSMLRAPHGNGQAAIEPCANEQDPLRSLVARLGQHLRGESFARPAWETRVRALASSIGTNNIGRLIAIADEDSIPKSDCIAAVELLSALQTESGRTLPPLSLQVLAILRAAAFVEGQGVVLSNVAARALAAVGSGRDLDLLLERLIQAEDEHANSCASWALRAASQDRIAVDLALLASNTEQEVSAIRALLTLQGWARTHPRQATANRMVAAMELQALALDDQLGADLRGRALTAMLHLDEAATSSAAQQLLSNPQLDHTLRRKALSVLTQLDGEQATQAIDRLLWASAASTAADSDTLSAAEAMMRVTNDSQAAGSSRSLARNTLIEHLATASQAEDRRRAVYALARDRNTDTRAALQGTLLSDTDASVRVAAAWTLGRTKVAAAERASLVNASESDESSEVRRMARHVLGSRP